MMHNQETISGALLLSGLLCATPACAKDVRGSGTAKSEVRQVAPFTGVDIHGALRAEIDRGSQRVEVSGDDNLVPLVRTEVKGGRLIVEPAERNGLSPKVPLLVRISAEQLSGLRVTGASEATARGLVGDLDLQLSGASKLSASDLRGERVAAKASGASRFVLSGKARLVDAELSGASALGGRELVAETVILSASGASRAETCASARLSARLSGASHGDSYCKPGTVEEHVSGASSLTARP